MKLDIDESVFYKIIIDLLKKDYISQQNEIKRLLGKERSLQDHEREDLWMHKETAEGLAIVLKYYMYIGDAEAFINEHKI